MCGGSAILSWYSATLPRSCNRAISRCRAEDEPREKPPSCSLFLPHALGGHSPSRSRALPFVKLAITFPVVRTPHPRRAHSPPPSCALPTPVVRTPHPRRAHPPPPSCAPPHPRRAHSPPPSCALPTPVHSPSPSLALPFPLASKHSPSPTHSPSPSLALPFPHRKPSLSPTLALPSLLARKHSPSPTLALPFPLPSTPIPLPKPTPSPTPALPSPLASKHSPSPTHSPSPSLALAFPLPSTALPLPSTPLPHRKPGPSPTLALPFPLASKHSPSPTRAPSPSLALPFPLLTTRPPLPSTPPSPSPSLALPFPDATPPLVPPSKSPSHAFLPCTAVPFPLSSPRLPCRTVTLPFFFHPLRHCPNPPLTLPLLEGQSLVLFPLSLTLPPLQCRAAPFPFSTSNPLGHRPNPSLILAPLAPVSYSPFLAPFYSCRAVPFPFSTSNPLGHRQSHFPSTSIPCTTVSIPLSPFLPCRAVPFPPSPPPIPYNISLSLSLADVPTGADQAQPATLGGSCDENINPTEQQLPPGQESVTDAVAREIESTVVGSGSRPCRWQERGVGKRSHADMLKMATDDMGMDEVVTEVNVGQRWSVHFHHCMVRAATLARDGRPMSAKDVADELALCADHWAGLHAGCDRGDVPPRCVRDKWGEESAIYPPGSQTHIDLKKWLEKHCSEEAMRPYVFEDYDVATENPPGQTASKRANWRELSRSLPARVRRSPHRGFPRALLRARGVGRAHGGGGNGAGRAGSGRGEGAGTRHHHARIGTRAPRPCALLSAPCALLSAPCALRSAPCPLPPPPPALCPLRSTPCVLSPELCALRPILCALCTAPYALRPMHCALCSAPYALRPMLCALCTAPYALRTLPWFLFPFSPNLHPPPPFPTPTPHGCPLPPFPPPVFFLPHEAGREGRKKEFEGGVLSIAACLNLSCVSHPSPSPPPHSFLSDGRALPPFLLSPSLLCFSSLPNHFSLLPHLLT
ncbi:unnamed protein product [Closterium sp. Naga37s-1]|nr:unnamed protein product [Closterium sp. Naga37s-1]